jgi:formylglycine-generating enzyme required for sulfatase activity
MADGGHDVFVAWDHSEPTMADVLAGAKKLAARQGVRVHELGRDAGANGVVSELVQMGVRQARHGVLVFLDAANVNVGWELGLALGCGRSVSLACLGPERAPWLVNQPPMNDALVQPGVDTEGRLLEKIVRLVDPKDGELPSYKVPGEVSARGTGTLVLAPAEGSGSSYLREASEALPGCTTLPHKPWSLNDLPRLIHGIGRVVLLLPQPGRGVVRDVEGAARVAIVAGFAHAHGRELVVVAQGGDRVWVDLSPFTHLVDNAEEAAAWLRDLDPIPGTAEAADPIAAWRRWVRRHHSDLVPFAEVAEVVTQRVQVALGDAVELRMQGWRERLGREGTLFEVLTATSTPDERGRCGRWLIAAEPGAGKTTSLRQVAQQLAGLGGGPVPVIVSLAELMERDGAPDVLGFVEKASGVPKLAEALRKLRGTPGALWLLLDGLDEVAPRRIPDACRLLKELGEDEVWNGVVVVATSRTVVLERHDVPGYAQATLSSLSEPQQKTLLQTLAPEVAGTLWQAVQANTPLADLVKNPLMLTLYALTGRDVVRGEVDEPLAVDRVGLYRRAVRMLLVRGRGTDGKGVKNPAQAELVLAELSLRLQGLGGEAWTKDQLSEVLLDAWQEQAGGRLGFVLEKLFGDQDRFLEEVSERSALLGPRDGPGSRWRFLHRSLREYLAAVGLRAMGEEAVGAWVGRWKEELGRGWDGKNEATRPDPARYGEVFALLCGMEEDPTPRLERLRKVSVDLLVRALTSIDGLAPERVVGWFWDLKVRDGRGGAWDGDDLEVALSRTGAAKAEVERVLWARFVPYTSTLLLGIIYVTLERLVGPVNRERFFHTWGRKLPTSPPHGFVCVEAGSFLMGSPEGVGRDSEDPQHQATLTRPFLLGRTTVTRAAYAAFDPAHTCPGGPTHPVTMVSWYEARLYAAWLAKGGRLPTEAEWEYACRAGTTTLWSHGDDEAELAKYAWVGESVGGNTHPVGMLLANPWGLRDMHGNVLEWCQDAKRSYDASAQVDPEGPTRGTRVVRGGKRWNYADECRSASRGGEWPGRRTGVGGFRVRLPAPAREP